MQIEVDFAKFVGLERMDQANLGSWCRVAVVGKVIADDIDMVQSIVERNLGELVDTASAFQVEGRIEDLLPFLE